MQEAPGRLKPSDLAEADGGYALEQNTSAWPAAAWYIKGMGR